MTILRSLLFVPGNKANMLAKALALRPDAFVPDMEDSVPEAEKANARVTIAGFLPQLAATGMPVIPRVNALDTHFIEDDLAAVVGSEIRAVSVGKIRTAGDISTISQLLTKLEARAGLAAGSVQLVPWIETAEAIVNCTAICRASNRILGLAFGGEDFTNDMGIERLEDESQVLYARSKLCIAARAAHVLAFDTPYFKLRDPDGLRANALAREEPRIQGQVRDPSGAARDPERVLLALGAGGGACPARDRGIRRRRAARPRVDVPRRLGHRRAGREARPRAAGARRTRQLTLRVGSGSGSEPDPEPDPVRAVNSTCGVE